MFTSQENFFHLCQENIENKINSGSKREENSNFDPLKCMYKN